MATISKTSTGSFKAIIRKNQRVIKTKTFKLKKDVRTWAKAHRGRPTGDGCIRFSWHRPTAKQNPYSGNYIKPKLPIGKSVLSSIKEYAYNL